MVSGSVDASAVILVDRTDGSWVPRSPPLVLRPLVAQGVSGMHHQRATSGRGAHPLLSFWQLPSTADRLPDVWLTGAIVIGGSDDDTFCVGTDLFYFSSARPSTAAMVDGSASHALCMASARLGDQSKSVAEIRITGCNQCAPFTQ